MTVSGLTPAPVILDSRQRRFAARLENAGSIMLKDLHKNPSSAAPICRVVRKKHEHGRTTKGMNWPTPGQEPVVRTTILGDTTAAKIAAQCWAIEKQTNIGEGVWMWWRDESRSDNGRVGAAAVCKQGKGRRCCRGFLRTGWIEVFDAELWVIGLVLDVAIEKRDTFQKHAVKAMEVISDSPAEIRQAAHLE